MAIDQQWIPYIPLNHRDIINLDLRKVIDYINTSTSR